MAHATTEDGIRLYFRTDGSGPPLLLVNGQGSDHTRWEPMLADYSAHFTVIRYDHRGTGRSDKPVAPPYSMAGLARDATAVLDAAGIGRAHVLGHSLGGRVAQWLAIDHADRIGGLVLVATTPGDAHGVARPAEVSALMAAPPTPANGRAMLELMYTPAWLATHPEAATRPLPDIPPFARELQFAASQAHDSWSRLPEIGAPTLVVHGGDDVVNPAENGRLLAERIPGARLLLIPGARHLAIEEFATDVGSAVTEFLRSLSR